MKPDDRYVAVIYIWGSSSTSERATHTTSLEHECLPEEVSKTIEDAMMVAKSLELRYLWVDWYCNYMADGRGGQAYSGVQFGQHLRTCICNDRRRLWIRCTMWSSRNLDSATGKASFSVDRRKILW
jgi:hypothetical protein